MTPLQTVGFLMKMGIDKDVAIEIVQQNYTIWEWDDLKTDD